MCGGFEGLLVCFSTEFAYMRKVTTKADVFSFGVIVMEFLTKKRPTGSFEESGVPVTLQQYIKKCLDHGSEGFAHFLDPHLISSVETDVEEEKLVKLLELALSCTQQNPDDRPDMNEVLTALLKISGRQ